MEEWRPIPKFEGYEVSNLGRVRSRYRIRKLQLRKKDGYLQVGISSPDERTCHVRVHQLVCEAFNGPKPFPGAICLHRDDIRTHNTPDNLYWGTVHNNWDDHVRNRSKIFDSRPNLDS